MPRCRQFLKCLLLPVLLALLGWPAGARATERPWPTLSYTLVFNVPSVTHVTHAGDGSNRLFATSQPGTVHVFDGTSRSTFLDLTARVLSGGERGLLSVAFPPGYAAKRHCYVNYTRKPDGATVVSRFHVPAGTPNQADPNSEEIVLVVPQPFANHNGGLLLFGPDGYLYIGMGDGGGFYFDPDPENHAQTTSSLLGKMLRIDVESGVQPYAIPPGNPFVNDPSYRPEIWALGLRNPWKFSFDRVTGDLYIADVGEGSWEEINRQPGGSGGGQNYGWKVREGNHDFQVPPGFDRSTLTDPVAEISHAEMTSITGGYFYRGPSLATFDDTYFFGDFVGKGIWAMRNVAGTWTTQRLDTTAMSISTFGEDEAGRLYVADYGGNIYRLGEGTTVREVELSHSSTVPYGNDIRVQATCQTPGAVIRYAIGVTPPTESSPIFPPEGLLISTATDLVAGAFRADLAPSFGTYRNYRFRVASIYLGYASGYVINPQVGLNLQPRTQTEGAEIRYTTDGSTPNASSQLVTGTVHVPYGGINLKFIGLRAGYQSSPIESVTYQLMPTTAPVIHPDGGANGLPVRITTYGGKTNYTLDGSIPTAASPVYRGPFVLPFSATVQARTMGGLGYLDSPVSSATFVVKFVEAGSSGAGGGSGIAGYADHPVAQQAQFRSPEGICLLDGYLIVADTGNHAIRLVDRFGGITTLAGDGTPGFAEGPGNGARFSQPRAVCTDSVGRLYVSDAGNQRIRRIDPDGTVSTVAGSGVAGQADGPAATAQFQDLGQLVLDGEGNLYVASGDRIRRIGSDGTVNTIAQVPEPRVIGLARNAAGRMWATCGSGIVYEIVRGQAQVFAGSANGYSDGPRLVARFTSARGLTCDSIGNLYVCDGNRVRKILPDGRVVTSVDTVGSGNDLANPRGCVEESGSLWVVDTDKHRLRWFRSSDWDSDGIPDQMEGGASPYRVGVDDRMVDSDGDGISNSAEHAFGTDPSNARSVVRTTIGWDLSGRARLEWNSVYQRSYQVQASDDLVEWYQIYSGLGSGQTTVFTDPNPSSAKRFYRVATP